MDTSPVGQDNTWIPVLWDRIIHGYQSCGTRGQDNTWTRTEGVMIRDTSQMGYVRKPHVLWYEIFFKLTKL
jgi:hypothetical protein